MVVTWSYDAPTNTATASGAGTTNAAALIAADQAGAWNKFVSDQSGVQIICSANIAIDNGVTFLETKKHFLFTAAACTYGAKLFDVLSGGTIQFGTLVNEANHATKDGCAVYVLTSNRVWINCEQNGRFYVYSSIFYQSGNTDFYLGYYITRIWNSIFSNAVTRFLVNCDVYNLYACVTQNNAVFTNFGTGNTLNKITVVNSTGLFKGDGSGNPVIKDIYCRSLGSIAAFTAHIGDLTLINPDIDVFVAAWFTGAKVFIIYEFDLQVVGNQADGAPIEDAEVCIYDKKGVLLLGPILTDANGKISTQNVPRGFYDWEHGDILQDYAPIRLVIKKPGYQDYRDEMTPTTKTNYQISMNRAVGVYVTTGGGVLIDLMPSDPVNLMLQEIG
jgi:hypothetical protein